MPSMSTISDDGRPVQGTHGYWACYECRRKKAKCDMRHPVCGRCQRVGDACSFPTKRKTPEFHSRVEKRSSFDSKLRLERLVELLEDNLGSRPDLLQKLPFDHHDFRPNGRPMSATSTSTSNERHDEDASTRSASSGGTRTVTDRPNLPSIARAATAGSHGGMSPETVLPPAESLSAVTIVDDPDSVSLHVSSELASELIVLYFDKIQAWLPMLHRPRFYARFMNGRTLARMDGYSIEEALLIFSMFALSARHSRNALLSGIPQADRGASFVTTALTLYDRARRTVEPSSLIYLQGCLALGFYIHAAKPSARSWVLTGVCVRIAYELELDVLDQDDQAVLEPADWSLKEEMRRAWWLVWELDAFGSTVAQRPYAINGRRMSVRLPVSDSAWFADSPVDSPVLRMKPSEAWKALRGSPNQDERAWFLVANCLFAMANDFRLTKDEASETTKEELLDAMTCFSLALPRRMHLNEMHSELFSSTFTSLNWVIGIHLMMMIARASASIYTSSALTSTGDGAKMRGETARIIRHWNVEQIALSHPFFACTILSVPDFANPTNGDMYYEMSSMVLDHFAEVWRLGSLLHRLRKWTGQLGDGTPEDKALAKRFCVLTSAVRKAVQTQPTASSSKSASNMDRLPPTDEPQPVSGEAMEASPAAENDVPGRADGSFASPKDAQHDEQALAFDRIFNQRDPWADLMDGVFTADSEVDALFTADSEVEFLDG